MKGTGEWSGPSLRKKPSCINTRLTLPSASGGKYNYSLLFSVSLLISRKVQTKCGVAQCCHGNFNCCVVHLFCGVCPLTLSSPSLIWRLHLSRHCWSTDFKFWSTYEAWTWTSAVSAMDTRLYTSSLLLRLRLKLKKTMESGSGHGSVSQFRDVILELPQYQHAYWITSVPTLGSS